MFVEDEESKSNGSVPLLIYTFIELLKLVCSWT